MNLLELHQKRCDRFGNPLYWIPETQPKTPLSLYQNSEKPVRPEWGVAESLSRSLAINYHLEVEGAGQFVGTAIKQKKIPNHPQIKALLRANIADETYHQRGIEDLMQLYNPRPEDISEATGIAKRWQDSVNHHHPLLPVAVLEMGVFMVNLAFWRVLCGSTCAIAAREIAKDEQRHAITNRSLLAYLNQPAISEELIDLTKQTISWIFEGLKVPKEATNFHWTKDHLILASLELIETGEAKALNQDAYHGEWYAHFETNNGYSTRKTGDKDGF